MSGSWRRPPSKSRGSWRRESARRRSNANDFDEALKSLFGESVRGLSPSTITRLKRAWESEYADWRQRDWQGHEFVYLWADGMYVNVRAEERRCVLVVIGCDVHGRKQFLAIEDGFRESAASWKALLLSLKDRGLDAAKLAVGDGALGFWAALAEVYPETREQRCWVHKMANALSKLPKSLHGDARSAAYSGPGRHLVPGHVGPAFRMMSGHRSGPCRSMIPEHVGP